MIKFLIITGPDGHKRLVSTYTIIYIDYRTGGGSRLMLREGLSINAKESVDQIIDTMKEITEELD